MREEEEDHRTGGRRRKDKLEAMAEGDATTTNIYLRLPLIARQTKNNINTNLTHKQERANQPRIIADKA